MPTRYLRSPDGGFVPYSGGSSGGGGTGGDTSDCVKWFQFEVTAEEAVKGITFDLPVAPEKIISLNINLMFGAVATQFALYSRIDKDYKSYGNVPVGNDSTANVALERMRNRDDLIFGMICSVVALSENARPGNDTLKQYLKIASQTIYLYSNTADVDFPAGTKLTVWGTYNENL